MTLLRDTAVLVPQYTSVEVQTRFREACPPAPVFLVDLDLSGTVPRLTVRPAVLELVSKR